MATNAIARCWRKTLEIPAAALLAVFYEGPYTYVRNVRAGCTAGTAIHICARIAYYGTAR